MNLFIKQVDKLRIKMVTKPRTYIFWNNTNISVSYVWNNAEKLIRITSKFNL